MAQVGIKRKAMNLNDKYEIILELEGGKKQCNITSERNLAQSAVTTLWKNRHEIKSKFSSSPSTCKKVKLSKNVELESQLLT